MGTGTKSGLEKQAPAWNLAEARRLFALSRDRFLPRFLTAVHPSFHTPHLAILVYGVLVAGLVLSGTFEQLAIFANLASLMLYFLCAIAAWVLPVRDVRTDGEPFRCTPTATYTRRKPPLWLAPGGQRHA